MGPLYEVGTINLYYFTFSLRFFHNFNSVSVSVYCIFATQIYTFTKLIRNYSLRRQRKPTRNQEAYTDVGSV